MPSERIIWEAFIIFFCVLGVAIMVMVSGCTVMERLDDAIWNAPQDPDPATSQPATGYGQPPAPTSPPIVEILATALGLGGFGGMARWLHNIKKNSNGRMDNLTERIQTLEFKNAERN